MTPAIKDAIARSQSRELMQTGGEQAREGSNDVNRLNYGRNLATAELTRPVLTQTGSTSQGTGTVKESTSPWATATQVGMGAAPLSM